MTSLLTLDDISVLDRQIELLNEYKPIPEHEVKALCDKVRTPPTKPNLAQAGLMIARS